MSYAADHLAWQQRVAQEDKAVHKFTTYNQYVGFDNPTDKFYKEWTKKNYITTNKRMHPSIQHEFVKKFFRDRQSKNNSKKFNQTMNEIENVLYVKLQPPTKPKPPSFFDQAYLGRSKISSVISDRASSVGGFRPYSNKPQDDALSYFEHKDRLDRESEAGKNRNPTSQSQQKLKDKISQQRKSKLNSTFYKDDNDGLITNPTYKLSKK